MKLSQKEKDELMDNAELAKMLERKKYKENMQNKIGVLVQLFCIGVICLLLAILF